MARSSLPAAWILVNRGEFTMKFIRYWIDEPSASSSKPKIVATVNEFKIAVGARGFATRPGEYDVRTKSAKPSWKAPDWAKGIHDGTRIAGNTWPFEHPVNPFAGGFISFEDDDPDNDNEGQGFHGVKFDPQLGKRVSHGCVRMATKDLERIYDKVEIGTPVVIV